MDIMLPLGSDILVEIGDCVIGTQTPIARIRNDRPVMCSGGIRGADFRNHCDLFNLIKKENKDN